MRILLLGPPIKKGTSQQRDHSKVELEKIKMQKNSLAKLGSYQKGIIDLNSYKIGSFNLESETHMKSNFITL